LLAVSCIDALCWYKARRLDVLVSTSALQRPEFEVIVTTIKFNSKKGKRNMGFLSKLKFWKKRNNTPTKVEACVSTEVPRTCDAATVSTDLTVMCGAYTQTETRMDGGVAAAAAKQGYERELEMNNQTIGELEEELAVSKTLTSDLMLNVISVEQQVREYAEKPIIRWSDECECREQVSAVADFLQRFIITYRNAKRSKPEVRGAKKSKQKGRDTKKSKPDPTPGGTTKVDHETQTEPNSRQRDCASADEEENVRRLEDKNRKLSELVEGYERKIVLLNEEMESILRDRTSHIQHIKTRYEEENHRQLLKMRDMRDELLWYKKRLPGIRMPTGH